MHSSPINRKLFHTSCCSVACMQKLRCDKLMGQLSRLQTDYDRLSLRNDLGLTKPELEQIAKRMVPPPAKVFGPFLLLNLCH